MTNTLMVVSTASPTTAKTPTAHLLGPKAFTQLLKEATGEFCEKSKAPVQVDGTGLLRGWKMFLTHEEGLTRFCLAFYGPTVSDKNAKPTIAAIHSHPLVAKLVMVDTHCSIQMTMFAGILCPGGESIESCS